CTDGNTYIAFAVTAEDETRSDEHTCFVQNFFGQFFHVIVRFGNTSPKEHTYLIGIQATTEYFHNLFCQLAAAAIYIDVRFFVPFHTIVVSLCGGQLHGAESS